MDENDVRRLIEWPIRNFLEYSPETIDSVAGLTGGSPFLIQAFCFKLVAHMTSDQHGAQAAFRRLGFVPEALLADYVEDRNGTLRDMVIMSFDIDGHTDSIAEPVRI